MRYCIGTATIFDVAFPHTNQQTVAIINIELFIATSQRTSIAEY
jgi:hypothetical protein